ncbi:MAG TPA: NCS1 family nucleobase:cation symporter-1 [Pyrinomonadaceae bacterium]|jgi:NCS1 family nucleobase:cation symporter-1|nr:NCS1 family nucleobase:cation symporter-1 [Pyrinomonadaceae bacterium]
MAKDSVNRADIAVTQRDFEELSRDVSASPLWNRDLAPTTIRERTWSTWNIAALWIGMSVVITTYTLAGGFIEAGMTWYEAMLTILLGNTIVLIPMILNAHAGTKYGVSFPVLCRAAFGTRGANIPAVLRAVVACGWFGIQTWIGGTALDALFGAMSGGWNNLFNGAAVLNVPVHTWIAFFVFWAIEVFIILKGVEGIKYLETWSAPLLLGGGAALLAWASWRAGGLGRVLTESSALQKQHNDFWAIFPGSLTASVGYWATLSLNIPDFTRYAKSQKSQMIGQALGLPLTMTAFAFIGVAVTSATLLIYGVAIPNPVDLMARFDSIAVILFATAVIFAAQLTTNMAANVVSPSNDFSNLNPKRISYVTGGLITALIGVVMMPWKLMETMGAYIFTWLIGYSGLMGAIAGILICDYWVLRRQRLDLVSLFDPDGRYSYLKGFNWRAIAALVLAILPVVPGFLRAAATPNFSGRMPNPNFFDTLYTYAWFVTFALGFILYYALMSGHLRKDER